MKIVNRKISDLIAAEYNPRQLTEAQASALRDSLKRFGMVDPVIVNRHPDRENIIVGGHMRLRMWHELGNTEVPTVEVDLDRDRERELNVRLNRNTGEWDWDALANSFDIEELTDWGFDDTELAAFEIAEVEPPELQDGDRAPFRQATFTLHDEQWEEVDAALAKAKADGGGESAVNENSNGNALAWICGRYNRGA